MSTLFAEEHRIAELLHVGLSYLARDYTVTESAVLLGVPASTLQGWLAELARAEARNTRRRTSSQHQTQPINASL